MKKLAIVAFVAALAGCSVANVVNRGEYVDRNTIKQGEPRKGILAKFGEPMETETKDDGTRSDMFRIEQGEKKSGKAIKGAALVVAAVLTLGLSESVAHPTTAGKEYVVFEVFYDKNDRVDKVIFISE